LGESFFKLNGNMDKGEVQGSRYTLEARNLAKSYKGRKVVDNVDIHINKGEIVGLLGPNGAGKTTTFYMIVGLVRPDSGEIIFRDFDITKYPVYKRAKSGLGYLAQEPSVFRKLSVENNINAILETLNISRKARKARLEELLESFNLTKVAKQMAYTLSGGERRKLEIARALVQNPAILMLDEPFAGVDPLAVADIQQVVRDLQSKGYGILITDHNVRETLSVVDRAYLLFEGKVLREGTSDHLISDPEVRKLYLGEEFRM
jgi:lipopolysaccharide export system ATP-binding protein